MLGALLSDPGIEVGHRRRRGKLQVCKDVGVCLGVPIFIGVATFCRCVQCFLGHVAQPMRSPPSQWPSLRRRTRVLASEIFAEAIAEVACLAERTVPPPEPGVPSIRARLANSLIASIAIVVATIGRIERLLGGSGGLPVNEIRETTLHELRLGEGALNDKRLLPSAYEVWVGERPNGLLRMRYTYDVARLRSLLPDSVDADVCVPLALDNETQAWVRAHVETPAPGTQLAVWRALKRRMYHYDAGVVAFYGFPRNFLLSTAQWQNLLSGRPRSASAVALDVGAGDGSLNLPLRSSFSKIVATELTTPLVLRCATRKRDAILSPFIRCPPRALRSDCALVAPQVARRRARCGAC
jgi:hypothetical protein